MHLQASTSVLLTKGFAPQNDGEHGTPFTYYVRDGIIHAFNAIGEHYAKAGRADLGDEFTEVEPPSDVYIYLQRRLDKAS